MLGLGIATSAGAAGVWDTLTPAQQATLNQGQQVFVTEKVEGKPWPKVFAYQLIHATPEQSAAVFTDYESTKTYIKNMKKSEISRRVSPRVIEVDYVMSIPLISDEAYTVSNVLQAYEADGPSYQVSWTLVRASSTKSSEGWVKFEPRGAETLMAYHTFVVPGSGMADFVKERALKQVRESVTATARQVETLRTHSAAELARLVDLLRAALIAP